ncbi:MAG: DUF2505 domain-containing protein [Sandaracinaceae bacterium]|nr:DUF2505 domain-containing protein [Sandaracinaceae bacterium]
MSELRFEYTHPIDDVFAKLVDAEHLRARSAAAGHRNIQIRVDEKGGAFEIRLERDIESEIPAFAKKFVNPVNHVIDTIRWRTDGEQKRGSYEAVVSARIRVRGDMTLRTSGAGTVFVSTCAPTVDVPLVGGKIADLVAKKTLEAIEIDCRFTQRSFAS